GEVATHDSEVDLARPDPLLDLARVPDAERHVDARVLRLEAAEEPGDQVDPGRAAGAQHEGATLETPELAHRFPRSLTGRERAPRVALQYPPGLGEGDGAAESLEE